MLTRGNDLVLIARLATSRNGTTVISSWESIVPPVDRK
jgi:hypothetical protein